MTTLVTLSTDDARPERDAVFANQGIPAGSTVSQEIETLYARALDLAREVAAPAGMLLEISKPDYEAVYHGEGRNEPRTPVGEIFSRADALALFAVTLGQRISEDISKRFRSNDLALASMLDSVASAAADKLAEAVERRFFETLADGGRTTPDTRALRYSPGYCGWHISGQKKLFEFLHPEQIGISLNDSFLMEPLKSVSGVIIAGRREIHCFQDSYAFCRACTRPVCRERIRSRAAQ